MKLAHAASDTLVLAWRNLLRIPRAPDLLIGFTVQPIMFVLLFVYVFGGAIQTPGHDYVDFLMPGIIVQTMSFGGFVTALGLADDLRKGLIDRFRSLPMARSAVLAGRTLADVVTNPISLTIMVVVGLLVGFHFTANAFEIVAGILLMLLFGFAFSWIFAFLGLSASSAESAQSLGFVVIFPLTFASSAFVPTDSMPDWLADLRGRQPLHHHRRRHARALDRRPGRQRRLGRGRLVDRPDRRVRAAVGGALPPRGQRLIQPLPVQPVLVSWGRVPVHVWRTPMISVMAMPLEQLPGSDLVRRGIVDLREGRETVAAALVCMARPRLRSVGIEVPQTQVDKPAGHALYELLAAEERSTAHSRYNALVARMVSFARAAEHAPSGRR